jgi:hypothetical protein
MICNSEIKIMLVVVEGILHFIYFGLFILDMPQVQFPLVIISLLVLPLVISFDGASPTCG